ncbi:MAG: carboxymuconolactone decarboxylase family protein [Gemmatimonadaceae bacterium]|nr:carboxymuconolactone decarboxylase family protein [Gemmatimonadaceae bacterium]
MAAPRFDFGKVAPEALHLLLGFERYVHASGLDAKMIELVKMRASQINGCARCLDIHSKDALALGETAERLDCVAAWRDAPFYSAAERAALALTEAVTLVANEGVPDDVYAEVRRQFGERQTADLVVAINAINCWNRINVTARSTVGDHKAGGHKRVAARE